MKLAPGVNFAYILQAAFKHADNKNAKNDSQVFVTLLGFIWVKAARKMLMKMTPNAVSIMSKFDWI